MVLSKYYIWKNSPAIDCCYNLYKKNKKIKGFSSANLLYETCKNNTFVIKSIFQLIKIFHGDDFINKTIWGYKKEKNNYKWELYNYEETLCDIRSFEIYSIDNNINKTISDFFDEYYLIEKNNEFYFGHIYRVKDSIKTKLGEFLLDNECNFKNNFLKYLEKLNYNFDLTKLKILNKYNCKYICIHQKYNDEFYIQHIGICKDDFIDFLIEQNYDLNLINHYKNQNYKISNEITLVYDKNFNVKRSAFYGIV
jgi:hypothetical protein